jgi:hypothetical protein
MYTCLYIYYTCLYIYILYGIFTHITGWSNWVISLPPTCWIGSAELVGGKFNKSSAPVAKRDFTHIIRFNIELSYEYIENGIIRFNKLIKYDHNVELSDFPMCEIPSILKMGWSYEYIELSYEYIENMGLSDWLKTE